MGDRIGWLDTARGIGIVAVVVGHFTSDPAVRAAMFHFHMPLFFMLSGIVFGTPAPARLIRRRAATLLLPYAAWLLVIALSDAAIAAIAGHQAYLPWDHPPAALARLLLGGTFLVAPFGIFWFVTCLFVTQIVAALVLRLPARWLPATTAAALATALLMPALPNPWGIISVPLALFFFLAGILHHRHADRLGGPLTLAAIALALLAPLSRPLDLKVADAGTPLFSILAALGLCHLILLAARRLPRSPAIERLGRASLVIMYVHLTLHYALRDVLSAPLLVPLALGLGVALWMLLDRFDATRWLMLGKARPNHSANRPVVPRLHHERA
ncbi:acyltransferase family protein [Sphingomonas sp.]|uniref:acyltransferase family protein n=1 Tax=Sphingomonas sp. TaxID=28214 RepID=UPI002621809E|nr:acyltransferase family protein [Sphingomonas sp.]